MEYSGAKIKREMEQFLETLETTKNENMIKKEVQDLINTIEELHLEKNITLRIEDTVKLVEIISYCEGILYGAKLFRILNQD